MYSFSSASTICAPTPRTMMGGSPPTARNARTGESTPPGITRSARCCHLRETFSFRDMRAIVAGQSGFTTERRRHRGNLQLLHSLHFPHAVDFADTRRDPFQVFEVFDVHDDVDGRGAICGAD